MLIPEKPSTNICTKRRLLASLEELVTFTIPLVAVISRVPSPIFNNSRAPPTPARPTSLTISPLESSYLDDFYWALEEAI